MKKVLHGIRIFFVFFIMMAFVVTCNFYLFLDGANMTEQEIRKAAPITFANVILLTLAFSIIDQVRRYFQVTKPVRRIREGMNKMIAGDFQTRIGYIKGENSGNGYDAIIKGLNEMAEELSGVETLRTDFISNVSHEIKTPLTVIQNYAAVLKSEELSKEQRILYAEAITGQTQKLSGLITNILKLNRLENQQIFPQKHPYNLTEQICECLLLFENAWEEKHLEIKTELCEDVMICQDAELLRIVWNNLLSNAVKFNKENGSITVSLKQEEDGILVTVSDTGCGISREVGRHMFEKFYQGDTSHASQGNGLGMALVKRVIDIVGGDIRVQSAVGEGTSITVRLKEE